MTGARKPLAVELVAGEDAPHHRNVTELTAHRAVITEQATHARLPIVDILMTAPDGSSFLVTFTGRELNALSAAIHGINMRNHGTPEP